MSRPKMLWAAVGCGAALLLLCSFPFFRETVSGRPQLWSHRRLVETHNRVRGSKHSQTSKHHKADDDSTEAEEADHKNSHHSAEGVSTKADNADHRKSHHDTADNSAKADNADHEKSHHDTADNAAKAENADNQKSHHSAADDSAKIEHGKSADHHAVEQANKTQSGEGEIGLHDCVDDQRTHLSFTNKTCMTREMLLLADPFPSFYLVCGLNASLLKDAKFSSVTTVGKELIELMLYAFLSGIIPLALSSLLFQSLHSKASTPSEGGSEGGDSCWTQFMKFVGKAGMFLTVPVLVGLNLFTTTMTTRRFFSEVTEFHSSLHFSWPCNFSLSLDYATHGEVLGVLVLAAFSWSDLIFNVGKILFDIWLLVSSCCWSCCDCLRYIFCCKWIPWHCLKILCCCSGPGACCKLLGSVICQYLVIVICAVPVSVGIILIEAVFVAAYAYAFGGMFLVFGVYACIGVCAGAVLLLLVYTATLPIQLAMKCMDDTKEVDTPYSFFQGAVERFGNDVWAHAENPFKLLPTDDKTESQDTSSQGTCLPVVSKIIKNKVWALALPFIILLSVLIMQVVSFFFMQIHSMATVDEETSLKLAETVQGSWTQQLQNLWQPVPRIFVETNSFVYEYLVSKIMLVPHMLKTVKEYLDPKDLIASAATLLDLKTKFHQLQKAVLALRVGSGLMMGPLKLFETLAKYDTK